jgi:exopolyphosphatase / guanosine-5'-triphosphate,3'-diphosphate pyrophosphatase
MSAERRAVIDVGTNSVKLLVGEVSGAGIRPLLEQSRQTRLGSGSYETHRLSHAAISRTAHAIAEFVAEAARWQVSRPRVIGTSAARDARNSAELRAAIRAACHLEIEIISGEQEADWAFLGVASDPGFHGEPLFIVDAGGGSTEFIVGQGRHAQFRRSFRVGTVRLLERLAPADPPDAADWVHCQELVHGVFEREIGPAVRPVLAELAERRARLIGTSGTTSILAGMAQGLETFDRERIEGTSLTREVIRRQRRHLWSLTLAERRRISGLPADRADVILTGLAIYEAVMETFDFAELWVSTRGMRFAALADGGDPAVDRRTPGARSP